MKKHTLNASVRDIIGRRVKNLRAEGKIPATIYGKDFKSLNLTVEGAHFSKVLKEAGTSGLVELTVGSKTYPVIIGVVQNHPLSHEPLHIEFRKVDLKEKIKTTVSLKIIGESPAVTSGAGLLLQTLQDVEVEALPSDLPEHIEVDTSLLKEVNDSIEVSKLNLPKGVIAVTEGSQPVVRITPPIKEEVVETPAPETVAEEEAEKETPGEEEKETEAPKEEKETEDKK